MAESFFAAPQNELVNRTAYPTRRATMNDIARSSKSDTNQEGSTLRSATAHNEVHDAYQSQQRAA